MSQPDPTDLASGSKVPAQPSPPLVVRAIASFLATCLSGLTHRGQNLCLNSSATCLQLQHNG
ncbi:MAG: hypothetical protein HWQ41_24555 [Nostoc sp. NOS(2021)]|uniref:hypothetical protein n=1 Tax=Nostoc sp. NOS(2021) TaxID=2815407 RepID=UPI0025EDD754|nr:hypothetical protein [Nostoc sp. NOS(2021)]MBN3898327.1 hypothetical protein [Nostoc sp. NOS(2021)]